MSNALILKFYLSFEIELPAPHAFNLFSDLSYLEDTDEYW